LVLSSIILFVSVMNFFHH